ncbi:MAG: hypothetical protein JO166_23870 [Deltaproteobacteria bacterium]|nr:hypothetical protein [Deltaproteobacteria bacterium]
MMPGRADSQRLLGFVIFAALAIMLVLGCQSQNTGSPGNTPNIAPQSSYRILGDIGTPFQALVSDSRSSWQVSGTIPTSIVIVNDTPPDRILVTKVTNDARLLSLQVIQGISVGTLDSTVSPFGTAVGNIGGTLPAFANAASPDVRFFVKTPLAGVFTGLVEGVSLSSAIESRVPAVILFDSPNGGQSGRVDGIFNQVSFAGVFEVDLVVNGQLAQSVSGGNSVTVKGNS